MVIKAMSISPFLSLFFLFVLLAFCLNVKALGTTEEAWKVGSLVKKDQRRLLVETEYGQISAVEVSDGTKSGRYHLRFFTLEPNALFLPVLLHADMVLYVHTGKGTLQWSPGDEVNTVPLEQGDIYRVPPGSVFYIKSDLGPQRQKLRINAIFANSEEDLREPSVGAYSSISEMIRGFDKRVLQSAFKAPEDVIEELTSSSTEAIIHTVPREKSNQLWEWETTLLKAFVRTRGNSVKAATENKKKKVRTFNLFKEDPDFKNCNGWSTTVTKNDLPALKHTKIGVFMVNLTKGSMMGPHWNPMASEITIVVQGEGMVRVVCPSNTTSETECKNMRFRVEEGDVFAVSRYHPMAQMAFNNESLVFMGFSTSTKKNYPQFLAGKATVLRVFDKSILAAAFGVNETTIAQLLAQQEDMLILDCTSCAEEEEMKMEEEIEKEREEEEARRREEEEEKRREEEEARKREEEEEEEEARRREEEERRQREEKREREREREEEEERRREEEEQTRQQEEEERESEQQEEEEQRRQEEEEEREREQQEEEARKQEEEEQRRQEEGETGRGQEEERRQREKEQRQQEEREQEEARRREEKEREQQEEGGGREEPAGGEEEEARKQEEERARREEEQEQEQQKREGGGGGEVEGRIVLKKIV